jgi:hypothetical protein
VLVLEKCVPWLDITGGDPRLFHRYDRQIASQQSVSERLSLNEPATMRVPISVERFWYYSDGLIRLTQGPDIHSEPPQ